MDWIHCNNCFSQLEPGITLHLTSCGHMFCNKCLENGVKESTCIVCRLPCSVMKLVPDMKPEIQDYFTDPEEIIKKACEVLQFQRQHRRRLLSYLLQSTKKFYKARTELKRVTELCQKQHSQLKEYQKVVKSLESQLAIRQNQKVTSPFALSPTENHLSPGFIQGTPSHKRPAKSTPYNQSYQSNLVTPSRITKQRSGGSSAQSQRSGHSQRISSTVRTPPTPDSVGSKCAFTYNAGNKRFTSFVRECTLRSFHSSGSDESGYSTFSKIISSPISYCSGKGSKCCLSKDRIKIRS